MSSDTAAEPIAPAGCTIFYFCEKCGKRVTGADLAAGRAHNKQLRGFFCGNCSDGTMTLAFDAATVEGVLKEAQKRRLQDQRPSTASLPTRSRSSAKPEEPAAETPEPRSGRRPLVLVSAGVIAASLTALIVMLSIGKGKPDPVKLSKASPPVTDVSTTKPVLPPVSPSSPPTPPVDPVRPSSGPAAQQLAKIREMITPDLRAYAEIRKLLEDFPVSFPSTLEAGDAKALLAETDANCAKLAEDALAAARASASKGQFNEAESALRLMGGRFGKAPWFESKGKALVDAALADVGKQRESQALKDMTATLEKARGELQGGRHKEASRLIEDRAKWPAEMRIKADTLAAEIERVGEASAVAKKIEEERKAVLGEFDRLMMAGNHAAARDYAKAKRDSAAPLAEILGRGERLAVLLIDEPTAKIRGARALIGRNVRLKLANGQQDGSVKAVTDTGLTLGIAFKINDQTQESTRDFKWQELHQEQRAEFARLGGFELNVSDKAIMATYAALAVEDLTAAGRAVGNGSGDPLGVYLASVVSEREKQLAYDSEMKRAADLVTTRRFRDAAAACEKALVLRPGDEKAEALLAEVRLLLVAPPLLSLDLGNGVTMEFVYIKPGSFIMGGDQTSDSKFVGSNTPKHPVTITKGYYLGKYEVTQAQYQAIMGKDPSRNAKGPNQPADSMGWAGANEFCKKASEKTGRQIRLPTEAEWEFACRAGSDGDWGLGADTSETGIGHTGAPPVGQKKPNAWGLYDMHGSVIEYVADLYDPKYYASSPKEDPKGPNVQAIAGSMGTTATVLLRGGSCSHRTRAGGYGFYPNWGFRVAVSAAGEDGTETPVPPPTPKR